MDEMLYRPSFLIFVMFLALALALVSTLLNPEYSVTPKPKELEQGQAFSMVEGDLAIMKESNVTIFLKQIIYMPDAEGVRGMWSGKGASIILAKGSSITTTSLALERPDFSAYGLNISLVNVTEERVWFVVELSQL